MRGDELEISWKIFTPLLHELEEKKIKPIPYVRGSRGPEEADLLRDANGFVRSKDYEWSQPELVDHVHVWSLCSNNHAMREGGGHRERESVVLWKSGKHIGIRHLLFLLISKLWSANRHIQLLKIIDSEWSQPNLTNENNASFPRLFKQTHNLPARNGCFSNSAAVGREFSSYPSSLAPSHTTFKHWRYRSLSSWLSAFHVSGLTSGRVLARVIR